MSISQTRHGHGDQRLQKQTNTFEQKRTHTAQHQMPVPLWGGNKGARGEWERVRRWLCLQAPGSWLVGPGSPNGHRFWGLRVSGLFEKDPWSRIKVIYLRTPDRGLWGLFGLWNREEERYRELAGGGELVGGLKREPGGKEEKKNYV